MLTDVSDNLPFLLHDVARQIRYAFEARARGMGVTRPQYRALLFLASAPGATQSEIADALDVERITLGRMIDRMEAAGLVERRADPADRRVWRLHMLPAAAPLIERLSAIGGEVEREALSRLAPAEREELRTLLSKLAAGMKGARCDRRKVAA